MAKTIQVSDDSGATWFTLPGGTGSLNREGDQITDTVFSQTFDSKQPGLQKWTVNADGVYKGFAGYKATIKKAGTPTAGTGLAMALVSGKTYKATDATKNCWDRTVAVTVLDGATDVTAQVESINYLFGQITFKASYTVVDAVTVDATYFALANVGKPSQYTLTQQAASIDDTDFNKTKTNGGYRTMSPGLRTVQLQLQGPFDTTAGFAAAIAAGTEFLVEVCPDGNSKSVARGFFKVSTDNQQGNVGALEEENATLVLAVPDPADNVTVPFEWVIDPTSTLSTSLQKCITAWLNETKLKVQYLHDGTNGWNGDAMITDLSLTGALNGMNSFTVNFAGDGALTAVP